MPSITITWDASINTKVVDGMVGGDEGYAQAIEGNPSPPTKAQLAKSIAMNLVKTRIRNYWANKLGSAAYLTEAQSVETSIQLT